MAIFTHVVFGTNDLAKARAFYDAALAPFGINRLMDLDNRSAYGAGAPELIITMPVNGEPASFANGGTVGFAAATTDAVDQFHAAALANGGTSEGEPGPRARPGSYAAYVRDPDGNKICAVHMAKA